MPINADKPHLWKADVEQSIDLYNDWFLRFAPETFRKQRQATTGEVAKALHSTDFLRHVTPENLARNPGIIPILRMVCAPPLARDRLIGLAHVSRNLILSMEGKPNRVARIPARMLESELTEQLQRICETIEELVDRDLFRWLETGEQPTEEEITRASTVVADRLCGATADPIIRNAQERRQLDSLRKWLETQGYKHISPSNVQETIQLEPGAFTFRLNISVGSGKQKINVPVDCAIQPKSAKRGDIPVLIEAKSAGDTTNTNKRRKEEAQKYHQLKSRFGPNVPYILLLCGYFEPSYLGYEASEGIDWIWEHRLNDLAKLLRDDDRSPEGIHEELEIYVDSLESKEAQRFTRQRKIDANRTQQQRNRLGQFSTPFRLARDIVQGTLSYNTSTDIYFLEPALGTGVFFSALETCLQGRILANATGIEIDSEYFKVASELWNTPSFTVINQDFLAFSLLPTKERLFNLICTNPPYVRHHHIASETKRRLQQRVQHELNLLPSGLSGLYVYFVLLSHQLLVDSAVASWLIPSEFLSVNYGRVLREYFLHRVTLLRIHQFDPADVQFEDALVSSCLVTYKKQTTLEPYEFVFSYGGTLTAPAAEYTVCSDTISAAKKWFFLQNTLLPSCTDKQVRLGDLFQIKRGIATGSNAFFIIDRNIIETYSIPSRFLKPILPSPRYIRQEIIEADEEGFPLLTSAKYLLDCSILPEQLRQHYSRLWEYMQSGESQGVADTYLCTNRKIWYLQEQRDPPLFLATYMGRSKSSGEHPFRFFLNLSRAVATNVFLLLYPKPALQALLQNNRARMIELLGYLNSLKRNDMINGGRTYGGGLHKLEPGELADIRLTHVPDWLEREEQMELFLA